MYIPLKPILDKYNIPTTGIIHVGANIGQEYVDYKKWGIKNIVFIEPCKEAFDVVSKIKDENVICINVACGSEEAELPMHISKQNQGQSNSFRKSVLHSIEHPDVLFTETEMIKIIPIDSLPIEKTKYNILVTDCEGYDSEVMKGAKQTLKHIDLVYSEINRSETREGNKLIGDFEKLLWDEGFVMIETFWPSPNLSWGDSVFIKRELYNG